VKQLPPKLQWQLGVETVERLKQIGLKRIYWTQAIEALANGRCLIIRRGAVGWEILSR